MPSRFRFRLVFVVAALASGSAYAIACDDSGGAGGSGTNDDDGGTGGLPDAEVVKSDAGAPATTMRIAHVAPDLAPVDFCYRIATSTSSFEGPVLGGGIGSIMRDGGGDADAAGADARDANDEGGDASGGDAGAASVGYRTVSRYLTLSAAGPLTIALVAPGATSCATPLFVADVTLDPGKLSTVAIASGPTGDGGSTELALVAFIDDRTTTPSKARVRMIHAALGKAAGRPPSGALAARASGAQTVTLAERVEPRSAGSPSAAVPVDSLGYATIAPVPSPAQLAVGAAAGTVPTEDASSNSWVSTAGELDLRGASLHTGFILTGDAQPYEVLWCTDTSTSGDDTTCKLVR